MKHVMSIDRNTSLSFVIHVKTHGNYREYTTDSANVLTYVKIYVGEADSQIDRQNGFKGNSTDPNSLQLKTNNQVATNSNNLQSVSSSSLSTSHS